MQDECQVCKVGTSRLIINSASDVTFRAWELRNNVFHTFKCQPERSLC